MRLLFTPLTSVSDLISEIVKALSLDNSEWIKPDQFSLFYTEPVGTDGEVVGQFDQLNRSIMLKPADFIADLFYRQEHACKVVRDHGYMPGIEMEKQDRPKLLFKVRFFSPPKQDLVNPRPVSCILSSDILDSLGDFENEKPLDTQSLPLPISPKSEPESKLILIQLASPFELDRVELQFPAARDVSIDSLTDVSDSPVLKERVEWVLHCATISEKLFLVNQIHDLVVMNRYPIQVEAAVRLAALQAQIRWGDHYPLVDCEGEAQLHEAVLSLLPTNFFTKNDADGLVILNAPSTMATKILNRLPHRDTAPKPISYLSSPQAPGKRTSLLWEDAGFDVEDSGTTSGPASRYLDDLKDQLSHSWAQIRGFRIDDCVQVYLKYALRWVWGPWAMYFDVIYGVAPTDNVANGPNGRRKSLSQTTVPVPRVPVYYVLAIGCDAIALMDTDQMV